MDTSLVSVHGRETAVSSRCNEHAGARTLGDESQLNRFFAEVERRALRIAEIGVGDRDEALDIVQNSMIKLARRYASRPAEEWTPLFYRILQNGIRDWHRRQKVRRRVHGWFGRSDADGNESDPLAEAPDPAGRSPEELMETGQAMKDLQSALQALPGRQREAFELRTFEGLDVAATATAMNCSDGSVKTHYFRAVRALRERLGEHWQ